MERGERKMERGDWRRESEEMTWRWKVEGRLKKGT